MLRTMLSFKLYHHHAFNDFKLLGDVDQIVSFDSRHPTIPTWGEGGRESNWVEGMFGMQCSFHKCHSDICAVVAMFGGEPFPHCFPHSHQALGITPSLQLESKHKWSTGILGSRTMMIQIKKCSLKRDEMGLANTRVKNKLPEQSLSMLLLKLKKN